ncbi:GTP cyclohydrolase FolE2 [Pseudomonas sp. NW5]|uniref:GTP cyclohydrolase FolE2 n=1 Tax=Pseudomonas sp. NW5 TaxID=2934934 RepID=UPI002021DC18|nr:GTP cyclohydrolase FolE2 [Pseudomonas sp. NW5]MCL7461377.1 GTP cyclohydrolase FolE2 [Pseudomonas sp. NW5]
MNAPLLPDIAAQTSTALLPLARVGMAGIAQPLRLEGERLMARISAAVSLDDPTARGIHMSRLYLALEALEHEELTPALLARLLDEFLASHADLSEGAYLDIHSELLLKRPALVSPLAGWKGYPLQISARRVRGGALQLGLRVEIGYSSTCPCSAALARQLIQQRFAADFADRELQPEAVLDWLGSSAGILATPHSQRSRAILDVQLDATCHELPLLALIDSAEAALGTALQTAVKRADEQAFALANGQNLMFCEDAARRLHHALRALPLLDAFSVRVEHAESLHAHDAVAESRWSKESA